MKGLTIMAVLTVAAFSATADLNPVPNGTPQSISEGLTLRYGASVTYTPAGENAITVSFSSGPTPPGMAILRATILVDAGIADSPFVGDYIARSINTIQFSITGSGYVPAIGLIELATTKRAWTYDFRSQVSSTPAEIKTVLAPLTASGWTCSRAVTNKDAAFAEDLQKIASVSIMLDPTYAGLSAYPAQSYTIGDVVLVNDDGLSSRPGTLSNLEKALLARFGFGYGSVDRLTQAMKMWDADGDGMFDFMEIWSENDAAYANSIFAAADVKVTAAGVDITWSCVKGDAYTVLRSDSLTGTFSPVSGLTGVIASETGYMNRTDPGVAGQSGPFYYRIRKD